MEPYEGISARCALCDGEIYRGEEYYHINGQAVCRDCCMNLRRPLGKFLYH